MTLAATLFGGAVFWLVTDPGWVPLLIVAGQTAVVMWTRWEHLGDNRRDRGEDGSGGNLGEASPPRTTPDADPIHVYPTHSLRAFIVWLVGATFLVIAVVVFTITSDPLVWPPAAVLIGVLAVITRADRMSLLRVHETGLEFVSQQRSVFRAWKDFEGVTVVDDNLVLWGSDGDAYDLRRYVHDQHLVAAVAKHLS